MFTIYINDLPKVLSTFKANLYADDTAITVTADTPGEMTNKLVSILAAVSPWFKFNRLSLNCDKTHFMLFGTKPKLAKYDLTAVSHEGTEITRVDTIKYLGMKLDPTLSFNHHVEYIKSC